MGIPFSVGVMPNVRFHQFASGYQIYDVVAATFKVKEAFECEDASDMRLTVTVGKKDHEIEFRTPADYDKAVRLLKRVGWTDANIIKVFKQLGIVRNLLSLSDEGDEEG